MSRISKLSALVLAIALVISVPSVTSGVVFEPRPLDRYHPAAMYPPLADQHYLNNIGGMVAMDDGSLWAADQCNHRLIHIDTTDGSIIKSVGTYGEGNAQFKAPSGIAKAQNGDLLVCDTDNNRIQVFDSSGSFKTAFGSAGVGVGEMSRPVDIAIDPADGSMLVAERTGNRVQRFTRDTYQSVLTVPCGELLGGITVASNSDFYVTLPTTRRVRRYDSSGTEIGTFGGQGSGDGLFSNPADVSMDASENVVVVDNYGNNAERFNKDTYEFVGAFGTFASTVWSRDYLYLPKCMTLHGDTLYFADHTGIKRFSSANGTAVGGDPWIAGGAHPRFSAPSLVACWSNPLLAEKAVWVVSTWNNRIQKYLYNNGAFVEATSQVTTDTPTRSLDVDSAGNLYVLQSDQVIRLNPDGTFHSEWPPDNSMAVDVQTIDDVERVYVADGLNDIVKVFNTEGAADPTPTIGVKGTSARQISNIADVAVTETGVFALESLSYPRVKKYDPMTGAWLLSFGTAAELGGPPQSIESDRLGNIYLSIPLTGKVLKYSPTGVYLGQIGSAGSNAGELTKPYAVAVSPDLQVFVAEYGAERIQEFRPYNSTTPTIKLNAVPAYNAKASLSVDVLDAFGQQISGAYPVRVYWSDSSTTGWIQWPGAATPGTWLSPTGLTSKKYIKLESQDWQGYKGVSSVISVSPQVALSNPVAPVTMYRTSTYGVWGTLKPRHTAGSYPVRIYKYRLVGSVWKSYGYVNARATNYSTYSRYTGSVKLPYAGKWKLRAYAPADSLHAATWSPGYDVVFVK